MPNAYEAMNDAELKAAIADLEKQADDLRALDLKLDMARGKPSPQQTALSRPMLDLLTSESDLSDEGVAADNYGCPEGLPSARRLAAELLGVDEKNVIVNGSSSLNLMHDVVCNAYTHGIGGNKPWSQQGKVKFLCPAPGYDRHFTVTARYGIENVPVPMTAEGPDMDVVRRYVEEDPSVKGIWCVPMYANPTGITYSDEVVRAFAHLKPAAPDFRIFWDNAYAVHHFSDDPAEQDIVLDIAEACREAGNPDRYLKFGSTSKITFPGAGVAALAASPANIAEIKRHLGVQAIGHDKLNQLRHARFLEEGARLPEHMAAHGALMGPKFELVEKKLAEELVEADIATWTNPRGGYFVSFEGPAGTAHRIVELAKNAGVTMTGAGATWPYGNDPADSNIRIAPSLPPLEELDAAMDVFTCCVKLAALEQLIEG